MQSQFVSGQVRHGFGACPVLYYKIMKKNLFIGALLIVIGILIGLQCRPKHFREVTKKVTDTLVVRDTHIIEKPVVVERTSKETLLVAVHDTTRIKDTVYVPLVIEKRVYKGEEYYAEVSGYQPSLDKIVIYPKTQVISKMERTTQTVTNRNALKLGIEASYCSTLSIPIYLEYERMLQENVGISGKVMYDLPTRLWGVGIGANVQFGW